MCQSNKHRKFSADRTPSFAVWTVLPLLALLSIADAYFPANAQTPSSTSITTAQSEWSSVDRRFVLPSGTVPNALAIGYPLIQTKAMVKGGGFLYIADTGKDAYYSEAAKIWRLNPSTGELRVFFTGHPLVNSKWLFYRKAKRGAPAMLVVSDYGVEPRPREPGTGEGAKVFTIPILPDGTSGQARILHEGPPFRSPEGITVIGDTVIVSDWAAGGLGARPDRPGLTFPTGRLFQLPLSGGTPTVLFEDQTWIVLIAACKYWIDDKLYLRLIDIEGGRPDHSRLAYLPQSGTPAFYRAEVLSALPLRLGPLERTFLAEDGPVTLSFSGLRSDDIIRIKMRNGDTFDDGLAERIVPASLLGAGDTYTFMARSDITNADVVGSVEVMRGPTATNVGDFTIEKEPPQPGLGPLIIYTILDNKHAGSSGEDGDEDENDDGSSGRSGVLRNVLGTPLNASADGTTQAVVLFPPGGGAYATLWRGSPLEQPMAVQFSDDAKVLYVSDQSGGPNGSGAIWSIPLPPKDQVRALFPTQSVIR